MKRWIGLAMVLLTIGGIFAYQRNKKTGELGERTRKVKQIAADLFREWEQELEGFSDPALKAKSRASLDRTRERYQSMATAMDQAQSRIQPVLGKLKDQVTFVSNASPSPVVT